MRRTDVVGYHWIEGPSCLHLQCVALTLKKAPVHRLGWLLASVHNYALQLLTKHHPQFQADNLFVTFWVKYKYSSAKRAGYCSYTSSTSEKNIPLSYLELITSFKKRAGYCSYTSSTSEKNIPLSYLKLITSFKERVNMHNICKSYSPHAKAHLTAVAIL
jgi:hypothetical protein